MYVYIPALRNPQSANPQKMRIEDSIHKYTSVFDFCLEIRNPQIRKKCGLHIQSSNPQGPIALADSPTKMYTYIYILYTCTCLFIKKNV